MAEEKKILLIKSLDGPSDEFKRHFRDHDYKLTTEVLDVYDEKSALELAAKINKSSKQYDAIILHEPDYMKSKGQDLQSLCKALAGKESPILVVDNKLFEQKIGMFGKQLKHIQLMEAGLNAEHIQQKLDEMLGITRPVAKDAPPVVEKAEKPPAPSEEVKPPPEKPKEEVTEVQSVSASPQNRNVLIIVGDVNNLSSSNVALINALKAKDFKPVVKELMSKDEIEKFCLELEQGQYAAAIVTNYRTLKFEHRKESSPQTPLEDLMARLVQEVNHVMVRDSSSAQERFTQSKVANMCKPQIGPADVVDAIEKQLNQSSARGAG